jgi:hypothetical protein
MRVEGPVVWIEAINFKASGGTMDLVDAVIAKHQTFVGTIKNPGSTGVLGRLEFLVRTGTIEYHSSTFDAENRADLVSRFNHESAPLAGRKIPIGDVREVSTLDDAW